MPYWKSYFITSFFLTLGTFLLLWFFNPVAQSQANWQGIISPLPSFMTMKKHDEITKRIYWLPSKNPTTNSAVLSDISAKAALSYDITTEKFLYIKNAKQRHPMASLTKIMTAIVALEQQKFDDQYLVRQRDLVGEDSVGFEAGERFSLEELLYGIFLHSGNDAAEVLAENADEGRIGFISDMNKKIKALGLTDTHFTNPTGLEGDGDQYTTVYDLLVMTRYGLTNFPLFAKTSSAVSINIPQTTTHKTYELFNETNLLTSYLGVDGLKTGYTPEAGYCLVTDLRYAGHHIIGIVLDSEDRRKDMKSILDYSLTSVGVTPPQHD